MNDHFKYLDESTFESEINSGLVLVDFYADWCGPCRMLTPVLEDVSKEVPDTTIAKIDIDAAQNTASTYQVTSIPTLILFKDGKEAGRLVGLRDKDTIKEFIDANSKKS